MSYLVALFGLTYGWMASRRQIPASLLALGCLGKFGVFFIIGGLWLTDQASGRGVVLACGDLAFACIWAGWLLSGQRHQAVS